MLTTLAQARPALEPRAATAEVQGSRVLFVCFHFPPDASAGAIRPAKFVKYLRRLGWRPYIVTVREQYLPARDESRIADVARLPIVRTRVWPSPVEASLRLWRLATRWRSRRASRRSPADGPLAQPRRDGRVAQTLKRQVNSLFELPDRHVGWLIPAAWRAYRLVKRHRIGVVVTSSPPWTTGLIGLLLSYVARVRIVTDLRDPWFTPYRRESWFLALKENAETYSRAGQMIHRWLERKLMQRSALVITATDRHARALRSAYAWLPDRRLAVIPNGYDAEDLDAIRPAPAPARFTISYVGTFYLDRSPRQLFAALAELIREGAFRVADLEVRLVGSVQSTKDGSLDGLITASGLDGCVRAEGPVSHRESLLRMMNSDVLLLYQPQPHCSIPGKAFEYLATERRILCLAEDGATADLIKQTGAGLVVAPDDIDGIKSALVRLYKDRRNGHARPGVSEIAMFERSAQARQLSAVLRPLL